MSYNTKLIVCDVDGTLLDTQKYWDKYEREVLSRRFGIDMVHDEDGNYIAFSSLRAMFENAMKRTGKTISYAYVRLMAGQRKFKTGRQN